MHRLQHANTARSDVFCEHDAFVVTWWLLGDDSPRKAGGAPLRNAARMSRMSTKPSTSPSAVTGADRMRCSASTCQGQQVLFDNARQGDRKYLQGEYFTTTLAHA